MYRDEDDDIYVIYVKDEYDNSKRYKCIYVQIEIDRQIDTVYVHV